MDGLQAATVSWEVSFASQAQMSKVVVELPGDCCPRVGEEVLGT